MSAHGLGSTGQNIFRMDNSNDGNITLQSERRIDNFINSTSNISAADARYSVVSDAAVVGGGTERFGVAGNGQIKINNAYNLPTADGSGNTFIRTDGAKTLSFVSIDGGEYNNVVVNASNIVVDWDHQSINLSNDPADFEEVLVFTGPNVPRRLRRSFMGLSLFNNDSNFITQSQANTGVVTHIGTVPLTVGGNLNVSGNIIATGNIDYENVTDLFVTDQKITLNANAATDANVEIIANRPQTTSVKIKWNEDTNRWTFTNDGSTFYNLAASTSDVAEGTNLYFTTPRANTAFDDRLADKTTDNLTEGSTNQYFTTARSNVAFDDRLADKTTSNLAEGTNLYYTTARANAAIADYTGTISTGNTISGTTVTATTEAKTNQISPNSGEQITLKDNNKLLFDGKKQQVSYNLGNVVITGSAAPYSAIGNNIYRESVSSNSEFKSLVGANYISGMMLTSFGYTASTPTYKITEGSNVVQVSGLTVQSANGSFAAVAKTEVDITTHFRAGQTFRFNLGSASGDGKHAAMTAYGFSDKASILSVANSSVTGGIANVIMSENATQSETLSCVGGVIGYICDTVSNSTTGDRVGIHGTAPTFVHTLNDITGMPGINYTIEGTNNTGANFFEFFDTTSLSSIDANITPSMLTRVSSAAQDYSIIDFESEDDGYFRFKDTILIGDHATPYSRGTLNDVKGFGINLQWTGEDDDSRYSGTVQPGLLFQSWTDNSLQGSSSAFLQNAGPRILLSTMQGKISNDPVSHAPVDGQELGKYGWWSTSADRAVPGNSLFGVSKNSSTNPPAYITCQAGRDWDVSSNVDTETYFIGATAENSGSGSTYMYYRSGEVALGVLNGQKLKIGQSGSINNDVRANSSLQAEYLTVDATETELYNRLQLYSLTTTEINALSSPQPGQVVYNSTLGQVCVYSGVASAWQKITQATM